MIHQRFTCCTAGWTSLYLNMRRLGDSCDNTTSTSYYLLFINSKFHSLDNCYKNVTVSFKKVDKLINVFKKFLFFFYSGGLNILNCAPKLFWCVYQEIEDWCISTASRAKAYIWHPQAPSCLIYSQCLILLTQKCISLHL